MGQPRKCTVIFSGIAIMLFCLSSKAFSQSHEPVIENGLAWMLENQSDNGSWDDDVYTTALALSALSGVYSSIESEEDLESQQ